MRRVARYLGRGVGIMALGLAIAGLAGYLAYLGFMAAVDHFVE
jgi:O-antigen/teichoic acid export membrane protein